MKYKTLYDIHPDVNPFTQSQAKEILKKTDITEDDICNWIPGECKEPAVRLGIFSDGKKYTIKYLCERHKQTGIWSEP